MNDAFEWIARHGGICSDSAYPYATNASKQGSCEQPAHQCANAPQTKVVRTVKVPATENALEAAVAQTPVAAAIQGLKGPFQFYSSGVLTQDCGTDIDHAVLVVGYGMDPISGTPFWKVKNDFGVDFGEDGFARIEKGKKQDGGQCGILLSASYPVLA